MKSVTRQYDLRLLILLVPASAILAGIVGTIWIQSALRLQCDAIGQALTVGTDRTVRVPLQVLNRTWWPVTLTGIDTSCGCLGVQQDAGGTLEFPKVIAPHDAQPCTLVLDTHHRSGLFSLRIALNYRMGPWQCQHDAMLLFYAISDWWVTPTSVHASVANSELHSMCYVYVYLPEQAKEVLPVRVNPVTGILEANVEQIPVEQVAEQNLNGGHEWQKEPSSIPAGLRPRYRITLVVATPAEMSHGSAIAEVLLGDGAARKAVTITWDRISAAEKLLHDIEP
jgi:hypothetical protein